VQFTAEEFFAAQPDPISQFSAPIAGHMNEVGGASDAGIAAMRCALLCCAALR
jgi:hypothetical protein